MTETGYKDVDSFQIAGVCEHVHEPFYFMTERNFFDTAVVFTSRVIIQKNHYYGVS
jgi:hypothetical protein